MKTNLTTGAIALVSVGLTLGTLGVHPASAQTSASRTTNRTNTKSWSTRQLSGSNRVMVRRATRRSTPYVTMQLKDASVRAALIQLFQKAHRDYSLDNSVDGVINLKITNKPFPEALRLIAQNSSVPFTYSVDSGVYFLRPQVIRAVRTNTPQVAEAPARRQPLINDPTGTEQAEMTRAETVVQPPTVYNGYYTGGYGWDSPAGIVNPSLLVPGVVPPGQFPYMNFYPGYIQPYGVQMFNFQAPNGAVVTPGGVVIPPVETTVPVTGAPVDNGGSNPGGENQ